MDYAAEIEQVVAEARHLAVVLSEDIEAINRQTAIRAEQFALDATQRLRELEIVEIDPSIAENVELQSVQTDFPPRGVVAPAPAPAPAPVPFVPDPSMSPEQQRQAEIRAAVARAKAAREARSTVAPSDGDYDSESEYYRRSTWLD
ncbi:hypothetical protein ACIGO9_24870 [Nocardia asteroides]|uniref:hypothetical protein n=1 Tax=Nocardia asteroides TaxID=1824 RepID=UPI0037CABAFB